MSKKGVECFYTSFQDTTDAVNSSSHLNFGGILNVKHREAARFVVCESMLLSTPEPVCAELKRTRLLKQQIASNVKSGCALSKAARAHFIGWPW